jgi:hypothetical protein
LFFFHNEMLRLKVLNFPFMLDSWTLDHSILQLNLDL